MQLCHEISAFDSGLIPKLASIAGVLGSSRDGEFILGVPNWTFGLHSKALDRLTGVRNLLFGSRFGVELDNLLQFLKLCKLLLIFQVLTC